MEELKNTPREYQKKIFETCISKDCLVVLPTGTGKTLIALMITIERFKKFPLEKILILAPTRPLIEQHFESFKEDLPVDWADMQLFTGKTPSDKRKQVWKTAEIIFSTPQCIANDLKKGIYDLSEVSLLVFDECHRCLKNYAYNIVAQKYKTQAKNLRVVGLTASPGGDKLTIKQVCDNLGIEAVEIRTRESPDVRPYLQELEFEKIEVDFPPELLEIKKLLESIYDKKIRELQNRKILFSYPSKTLLLKTQSRLMQEKKKDMNTYLAISATATALKISHALTLLETQTVSSLIEYMKDLFRQAEEKKSKGVQKLVKEEAFKKAFSLATTVSNEHPKLQKLKELIEEQFSKNPNSKIIIFAQFRETVRTISEKLNKLAGIKAENFVGQAIKEHGESGKTTGLKQKEQREMIEKFKSGKINILVATSIAEEGLDIPEVNEVIFYEPIPSAIRSIQRRGRTARLAPGALKILVTKKTLDEIFHYASINKEKRMHKSIEEIKKDFENTKKDYQQNLL